MEDFPGRTEQPIVEPYTLPPGRRTIIKPAFQVTLFSVANIIAGFGVQVVLAAQYGTGIEMDAFVAATTLPVTLTAILFSTLGVSFVPIFTEQRSNGSEADAWKVASSLTFITAVVLTILAILGILGAETIIRITVPGIYTDAIAFPLTVGMLKILFPSVVFAGISALFSSIAHSNKRFLLPAALPVVSNIVIIIGTVTLGNLLGIQGVAWARTIGAFAGLLLISPVAFGRGRLRVAFDMRHPGVAKTIRMVLPLALGAIIIRSNVVADRLIASTLSTGSISFLGYGYRILNILWAITSSGVVVSTFPYQSEQAQRNKQALAQVTSGGIRLSAILSLAVGTVFLILREPIIRVLFQRGEWDAQATVAVADIVLFYAGAFFVPAILGTVTYALYSLQQAGLTTIVAIAGTLLNIALLLPLSRSLGINGVALAYSISSIFNGVILTYLLIRKFRVELKIEVVFTFLKALSAAVISGLTAGTAYHAILKPTSLSYPEEILSLAILGTVFLSLYLIILSILKVEEVRFIWQRVQRGFFPSAWPK